MVRLVDKLVCGKWLLIVFDRWHVVLFFCAINDEAGAQRAMTALRDFAVVQHGWEMYECHAFALYGANVARINQQMPIVNDKRLQFTQGIRRETAGVVRVGTEQLGKILTDE